MLKGDQQVDMRALATTNRKKKRPPQSLVADDELSIAEMALLERLKEWRNEEARKQNVPAYVILNNNSLTEIALTHPAKLNALAEVGGIGAKKLERYGAALIRIVSEDPNA